MVSTRKPLSGNSLLVCRQYRHHLLGIILESRYYTVLVRYRSVYGVLYWYTIQYFWFYIGDGVHGVLGSRVLTACRGCCAPAARRDMAVPASGRFLPLLAVAVPATAAILRVAAVCVPGPRIWCSAGDSDGRVWCGGRRQGDGGRGKACLVHGAWCLVHLKPLCDARRLAAPAPARGVSGHLSQAR